MLPFVAFLFLSGSLFSQQKKGRLLKMDSLKNEISNAARDTLRANLLSDLILEFLYSGKKDTCYALANEIMAISKEKKYSKGIALAYARLAAIDFETSRFSEAMAHNSAALKIYDSLHNEKGAAAMINNIGMVYKKLGKYPEALDYYFKALRRNEKSKNLEWQANNHMNIGILYKVEKNNEEALKHYVTAEDIYRKLKKDKLMHQARISILTTLTSLKRTEEALRGYAEMLQIARQIKNATLEAEVLNNMGVLAEHRGELKAALSLYEQSLAIKEVEKNRAGTITSYINIGSVKMMFKAFNEARLHFKKALTTAKDMGKKELEIECLFSLSRADSALGDYKESFQNYKTAVMARDSLVNEENTRKTVQMEMQYDFDRKSTADSIKNAEAKHLDEINHQSQIRNQKLYTYTGLLGFLIMIVIAAISFVAFRNKKRANFEIAKQKHIVEEKQKEILDSIYYARRIQRALITSEFYIEKKLNALKRISKI